MRATFEIGQSVPYQRPRGIVGDPLDKAVWHALRVAPMREKAGTEILKRADVFAFYPVDVRVRHFRGKKIVTEHPTVSQIIYARFTTAPHWDVLRDRKIITGVFTSHGAPIKIPNDVIRQVQGLPTRAEEIDAAKEELRRQALEVNPGDAAEILDGPLAGMAVEIQQVQQGKIWWQMIGGTLRGSTTFGKVKKRDVV